LINVQRWCHKIFSQAGGANRDEIGGHHLEDCAIAPIDDTPNPFADGVRSYALDANKAKQLWAKSEESIGAAS
jgi:hypothetical protein